MIAPEAGSESGTDHQSLAAPLDGSRRLWSLWEMINYQIFGLIGWLKLLEQERQVMGEKLQVLAVLREIAPEEAQKIHPDNFTVTQADIDRINPFLSFAGRICQQLNLNKTEARVERFQIYMRPNILKTPSGIIDELKTLREALEDDVMFKYFYFYPDEKAKRLLRVDTEWDTAFQKFPSCKEDAKTAVDCYALDRHVACVFHCMMALEYGLRALAGDVGLSFGTQQWNTIIEQIESEITKLRKTLPYGTQKNERMQFLSEAAKEFFYFKDGWRNYVSHGRARYDEHQALSALEHTRAFMNHLATRLSE